MNRMKFKRGQLVTNINGGLYFVLDAEYPKMIVYCIESSYEDITGKTLEVEQSNFKKV